MSVVIVVIFVLCLVFGPQLWCAHVLKRYNEPIKSLPGTGGELATHLLKRFGLDRVKVEMGQADQNYFDPEAKVVCLSPEYYSEKSLTAITIAAHEVGHAIQDHTDYSALKLRTRFAKIAALAEKTAAILLVSVPIIGLITRLPHLGAATFLCGLTILLLPILMHLITLPVEFDASFQRALPILQEGNYLPEAAMPIAKKILTAAALTYLAASLVSLLNFYRWIAILRR